MLGRLLKPSKIKPLAIGQAQFFSNATLQMDNFPFSPPDQVSASATTETIKNLLPVVAVLSGAWVLSQYGKRGK